jgi:hypothetical protein
MRQKVKRYHLDTTYVVLEKVIVMVADFAIAFTYRSEVLAQIKAVCFIWNKFRRCRTHRHPVSSGGH